MSKHIAVAGTIVAFALIAAPAFAQTTKSANFSQGDRVLIAATINVRSAPNGSVVGKESTGVEGTLVGGPTNAAGYTWWDVKYDNGVTGWSAEDFMQSPNVALQNAPSNNVVAISTTNSGSVAGNTNVAAAAASPAVTDLLNSLKAQLQSLLSQINNLQ